MSNTQLGCRRAFKSRHWLAKNKLLRLKDMIQCFE